MKIRAWIDSLSKEQLHSYALMGFGFWPQLLMKMAEEDGFRIGCKSRYDFAKNMMAG